MEYKTSIFHGSVSYNNKHYENTDQEEKIEKATFWKLKNNQLCIIIQIACNVVIIDVCSYCFLEWNMSSISRYTLEFFVVNQASRMTNKRDIY